MRFHLNPAYAERRKALKWIGLRVFIGFLIFYGVLYFWLPFCNMIGDGFDALSFERAKLFWKEALLSPSMIWDRYLDWLWIFMFETPRHTTWSSFFAWNLPLVPTAAFVWSSYYFLVVSPHDLSVKYFGSSHYAREDEVKKMGLFGGKFLLLGTFAGKELRMPDSRSALCMGISGSGKTTGLAIPNVLSLDKSSLIINDPKEEIFKTTSGYRSSLGPVFHFKWTALDNPQKGVYWPSWNPLAPENMDSSYLKISSHVNGIVKYLIPDGPEGTDPYWVKAGRDCLGGMGAYLCIKCKQAKANDYFESRLREGTLDEEDYKVLLSYYMSMKQTEEVREAIRLARSKSISSANYLPIGSWNNVPKVWRGQDCCFAMLVDMLNSNQIKYTKEIEDKKAQGDMAAMNADPWQYILTDMVLETAYYNYGRLTLLNLNEVLSLPDKQRASVISMAMSGINIFKSAAARLRTSVNDICFEQLRGIQDSETGEYYPVTIYLTVPYEDLGSSASMLNNLFINMLSSKLISNGPGESGYGPFPASFILDDFQYMPSLDSITDGVVFGRSKGNSYLFMFQDWHQLQKKYGEGKTDILLHMPAAKIVKQANNIQTRNRLVSHLGKTTKMSYSVSENWLIGNHLKLDEKRKYKYYKDDAISKGGILKMKPDKELLIYTGYNGLPIDAKTPLYFKSEKYKQKASLPPSPHISDYILNLRPKQDMSILLKINLDVD